MFLQQKKIGLAGLAILNLGLAACGGSSDNSSSNSPPVVQQSAWDKPITLTFEQALSDSSEKIAAIPANHFTDVSVNRDNAIATIVRNQRVYISTDLGKIWHNCLISPQAGNTLSTVAISPYGQRIFIGGTSGQFVTLSAKDCEQERAGQVSSDISGNYLFEIKQAVWQTNRHVIVAMSNNNEHQRDGLLARGDIRASTLYRVIWTDLVPGRIQKSNVSQPVAAQSVDITKNSVILSGLHRITGNSRSFPEIAQNYLLGDSYDWGHDQLPQSFVGQVPKSISATGSNVDVTLYLVDGTLGRKANLFVTRHGTSEAYLATGHQIQTSGLPAIETTWYSAKVDRERRVWLATNRGLYRSINALPRHDD